MLPNFDDLVEIMLQQPRSISGEFFFPFVYCILLICIFFYLLFADSLLLLAEFEVRCSEDTTRF